jgi:uncharacterized protein YgiM (DUF1202 family)
MKSLNFLMLLTPIALSFLVAGCTARSVSINVDSAAQGGTATPAPKATTPETSTLQVTATKPVTQAQPTAPAPETAPEVAAVPVSNPGNTGGGNSSTHFVRTNDGTGVNVRASNSDQSAKVAFLKEGTEVMVSLVDRSGEWSEIYASGRIHGWVASRYLQSTSGQSANPAPQDSSRRRVRTLDGDNLNIRRDPSLRSAVVGSLESGTFVTSLETVGQWTRISASNGVTGYVVSEYLVTN